MLIWQHYVFSVSEVAMESSPGPSTSSGSRPEADHRAQSSAANTPRAGTHSKHTHKKKNICHFCMLSSLWHSVLSRYAVYPPESSSVKIDAKFLEESHPGSCLFWWYPPWWVIGILILSYTFINCCLKISVSLCKCWLLICVCVHSFSHK